LITANALFRPASERKPEGIQEVDRKAFHIPVSGNLN
jgi:hypothetical protein